MKLKKFDDTNIENPVNNARNLKDILQNNDLYSICLFLQIQLVKEIILRYGLGAVLPLPINGNLCDSH